MRTKLWRDSLENEAVESWSFRVRFSGGGTLYVQIPEEWQLFVMKVESFLDILSLLCVVKIDF